MLIQLAILLVALFRWPLLHRFLGTKRMHLLDAVMFTVFAAMNFANVHFPVDGWGLISLVVTGLCIWWAYSASKRFLNFEASNEQGKSNT